MEKRAGCVTALYPGTFDPLTNGHVSIVTRGLSMFHTIIVAVAEDSGKKTLFSLKERADMAKKVFAHTEGVKVEPFSGLLAHHVKNTEAQVVLRGMRALSDFENEFQMALMNRRLCRDFQTVFLMTDYRWMYISSSIIKEVAGHGGDIRGLVPEHVEKKLVKRLQEKNREQKA